MKVSLLRNFVSPLIAVTAIATGEVAHAATFSIGADSQGWFRQDGATNANPGLIANTFTGTFEELEHRSFFTFDVSGLTSPIQGGKLRLLQEFYFSGDPSETVTAFDVSAPAETLVENPPLIQGQEIFEDLGSGSIYGAGTIAADPGWSPIGKFLEIVLSDVAISAINEAQQGAGNFSLGLTLTSLGGNELGGAEGVRFSDPMSMPMDEQAKLFLQVEDVQAVPEPFALWGYLSVAALGGVLRKFLKRA
ncbi:MAG: hypothetical protein ACFBSF_21795 [Leptolyngbyaceae cyanobacterium]